MGKIKKYKNGIEAFLSGEKGQRFFNFAYSIGAAVVIWGALFKILHLPGGNALLSIGMGTEVLMFVLTAFDRPPREYHWEEVFEVFNTKNPEDRPDFKGGAGGMIIGGVATGSNSADSADHGKGAAANAASGTIIIGGASSVDMEGATTASTSTADTLTSIAEQMKQLQETTEALNRVSSTLLDSYRVVSENSDNITNSAAGYVDQMTSLNRNIAGLNTIYEIQLKSISSQLDNIDRVNKGLKEISAMYDRAAAQSDSYCAETQKMALYMKQLNSVYEKMITAMTINMQNPLAAQASAPVTPKMPDAKPAEEPQPPTIPLADLNA